MKAPSPENEAARLGALRQYQILEPDSEQAFIDFTGLVHIFSASPSSSYLNDEAETERLAPEIFTGRNCRYDYSFDGCEYGSLLHA